MRTNTGYVQLDPAVIEQARQMDLLSYLQTYEPSNLMRVAGNVYCTRAHDSLKISNGKWYWWSRGFGGVSALDYLIKVKEYSFVAAVEALTGKAIDWKPPPPATKGDEPKVLLLPPKSNNSGKVTEYLFERGIDYQLISECIAEGIIYESSDYHNAVFIGKDEQGTARYAALRSTNGNFKGDASGSDKRYSFRLLSNKTVNSVHLFESAVDLLSYATLLKCTGKGDGTENLLSLSGVYQPKKELSESKIPIALTTYLKANSQIKTIHLHLDNDKTGRLCAQTLQDLLEKDYKIVDEPPPVGKATIAAVKAIIAGTKALIAAIAAGGWIAVVVIIIICLIGLLVGSIFGVFFSGEDSGNGYTMPMAIAEINTEYADKLTGIRNTNAHDEVSMSGSRALWKDILAVYAVKTTTDSEIAQDVATMDEQKKELLSGIFWDMNVLTHRTASVTVTEITVTADESGNFVEGEETVTKTVLYITVTAKTAEEMAEQYGFSAEQKAQLAELLSEQYADLWRSVLYGIRYGSEDIVEIAISQIGNVGGEPYWSWYGWESRVAWCACFVSWCANEAGYIEAGIIPMFAYCPYGAQWFKDRALWQDNSYVPATGDIIFFDWEQDGETDHVGIVEYVEGEYVHTVEGNTSDSVARRTYWINSNSIYGYGVPMY